MHSTLRKAIHLSYMPSFAGPEDLVCLAISCKYGEDIIKVFELNKEKRKNIHDIFLIEFSDSVTVRPIKYKGN